mgnify:CR=1 FL=1
MALIVGDDFQHILRVLNTNVDGREKVRRRFRFLLVREWAFGVRMCGLFFVGFRGGEALFGIVRVSFGSNRISRRVGKMERDSRARRFLARWEYLRARMRLVRALWMLATRAKRRKKRCHRFVFFSKCVAQKGPKKGRATRRAFRVPRAKRFVYSPRDKRDFFSRHATGHVLSHENQRHRS